MQYNQKHFYNFDKNKYITHFVYRYVNALFHQIFLITASNERLNSYWLLFHAI